MDTGIGMVSMTVCRFALSEIEFFSHYTIPQPRSLRDATLAMKEAH